MISLLWSRKSRWKTELKQLTHNLEKPSPTYWNSLMNSARNPEHNLDDSIRYLPSETGSMEGISLSGSRLRKKTGLARRLRQLFFSLRIDAGMTVEASIVLSLFLFFFLNLGCAIEMIRLQGNLQLSLWQIGRELSVYGYALDSGEVPDKEQQDDNWWKDLEGRAFSSVFIKNRLVKLTGKEYLDSSPLTKGSASLQLWKSDLFGSGDIMDIVVTYSVSPWSSLAGFPSFSMANRYYTHIWNGYQLVGEGELTEENKTVYVTLDSEVYHLYRDCTHLQLSVQATSREEADRKRNQSGGRYRPCGKCAPNDAWGIVYITEEGDHYHYDRECSGLRRTVYSVMLREAGGLRQCSRCSQREP